MFALPVNVPGQRLTLDQLSSSTKINRASIASPTELLRSPKVTTGTRGRGQSYGTKIYWEISLVGGMKHGDATDSGSIPRNEPEVD